MMKISKRLSVWAFLLGLSSPVFGDVVGYETITLQAGVYTLLGKRFFSPPLAAGIVDIMTGTELVDDTADFSFIMNNPLKKYSVELNGVASDGKVLEILSVVSGNTLIVGEFLPDEDDVPYEVREILKLSDLIDPMTPQATSNFNPDEADLFLVPKGGGQFDQYYVSSFSSVLHPSEYLNKFINASTGEPDDPYLFYPQGIFYLRRSLPALYLVVEGDLKITNTLLPLPDRYNYFSSIYPLGATFETSDLALSIQSGTEDTADLVCLQDGAGVFQKYFYSDGTPPLSVGWRLADAPGGSENVEQENVTLPSGMAIRRRAPAPYDALMSPPDFYSGL